MLTKCVLAHQGDLGTFGDFHNSLVGEIPPTRIAYVFESNPLLENEHAPSVMRRIIRDPRPAEDAQEPTEQIFSLVCFGLMLGKAGALSGFSQRFRIKTWARFVIVRSAPRLVINVGMVKSRLSSRPGPSSGVSEFV